jgi:hypothetical protein
MALFEEQWIYVSRILIVMHKLKKGKKHENAF